MSFSSLWQLVKHSMMPEMKRGTRASMRPHLSRNQRRSGTKLWLELLEDRTLLSTVPVIRELTPPANAIQSAPDYITAGPDGNVWYSDLGRQAIGRVTPQGQITEFPGGLAGGNNPVSIATGPDGNIWFAQSPDRSNTATIAQMHPGMDPATAGKIIGTISIPAFGIGSPIGNYITPQLTLGPDGNIWFTEYYGSGIGRIALHAQGFDATIPGNLEIYSSDGREFDLTEINIPNPAAGIIAGNHNDLWFESSLRFSDLEIGHITIDGDGTPHVSTIFVGPYGLFRGLAIGPDGNLWANEHAYDGTFKIDTTPGNIHLIDTYYAPITVDGFSGIIRGTPGDIASGTDGNLWFLETGGPGNYAANRIGRMTVDGQVTYFALSSPPDSISASITRGPDGNLWFTDEAGRIGEILLDPGPDLAYSTLSISPNSSTVAGSTDTVTLKTMYAPGTPETRGGFAVTFGLDTGNGLGTFSPVTDNGDGTYTATFTRTIACTNKVLTAYIGGQENTLSRNDPLAFLGPQAVASTVSITVTPGPIDASQSTVTASSSIVASGSKITVTLTARDAYGNQETSGGAAIAFALDTGSGDGTFTNYKDIGDGTYTADFTASSGGNDTITDTIMATINGIDVGSSALVTAYPAALLVDSSVSVSPDHIAPGGLATVTLTTTDALELALAGLVNANAVTFELSNGSDAGTIDYVNNNGDGTYTATFTANSAGDADITDTIKATINGEDVTSAPPPLTVYSAASLSNSLISVLPPGDITAGVPVTVTLTTMHGSTPVTTGGLSVTFGLGGTGTGSGTFGPVTDNLNGTYTATFTGTTAGPNSITATITNGVAISNPAPVMINAGTATHLSLTLPVDFDPQNVFLGLPYIITVAAKDAYGNTDTNRGGSVSLFALLDDPNNFDTGIDILSFGDQTLVNGVCPFPITFFTTGLYVGYAAYGDDGIGGGLQSVARVSAISSENLQTAITSQVQASPSAAAVTIPADPSTADAVVQAISGLAPQTAPVSVYLNLGSGTYGGQTVDVPSGMTLYINGVSGNQVPTTVDPDSPAFTVLSGNVVVSNVTFVTTGNAPTILVAGGSLTLRNDVIEESTGYSQAAISMTGGTVDLGTGADPGGNIFNVNGTGSMVHNTTPNPVIPVGDTFEFNGVVPAVLVTGGTFTYNGNAHVATGSVTGIPGATPTFTYTDAGGHGVAAPVNVGTYTVSASYVDSANYISSFATATINVLKAPLTVTAINHTKIYGAANPSFTVSYAGFVGGNTPSSLGGTLGFSTTATISSPVGNYAITPSGLTSANYAITFVPGTLAVNYASGGFLAPVSLGRAFKQGSTIPIKWQLTDANGHPITSLGAITSLTITGTTPATLYPGNNNSSGATVLQNDGSQYVYNWQTKGFALGQYTITATLNDGSHTQVTSTIKLSTTGGNALVIDGANSTTTAGTLLAGDLTLYVDNTTGEFTAGELARINDAVANVETLVSRYGTNIIVVDSSIGTDANLVIDAKAATALGGYADGVLGATTDIGEITIVQGWNWYAGANASAIGAGQFDFQTVVTHELGHGLGLGHSAAGGSVMHATLETGVARRSLGVSDLNIPDADTGGSCGLHATPVGPIANLAYVGLEVQSTGYFHPGALAPTFTMAILTTVSNQAPVFTVSNFGSSPRANAAVSWLSPDDFWARFGDQPARLVPALEPTSLDAIPHILENPVDFFRLEPADHDPAIGLQQAQSEASAVLDQVFAQMAVDMDDSGDLND